MITYLSYITAFIVDNRVKEFKSISFINPTAPLINIEISLASIPVDFVKRFLLHDGYKELHKEHADICKVWEYPARINDSGFSILLKTLFDLSVVLSNITEFPDVEIKGIFVDPSGVIINFFSDKETPNLSSAQMKLLKKLGMLGMLIDNPNCEILLDDDNDEEE